MIADELRWWWWCVSFTNDNDFVVIHFAGPVIYTCVDFVERNRDALFDHVNTLMGTSTNKTVRGTRPPSHPPTTTRALLG